MLARRLTPILNVSDIQQSFSWHRTARGKKPGTGARSQASAASAQVSVTILLCANAQGSRGRSALKQTVRAGR